MTEAVQGSCLCGGVAFEISGKTSPIGQCHCSRCRKVSGTDGNAVLYARVDGFAWLRGEGTIRRYVIKGGGWSSSFCETCGSPVPFRQKDGRFWFVPAGLLDGDPGHRGYAAHIFVGSKAPWVAIADGAPQHVEGFGSALMNDGAALAQANRAG